MLSLQNKITINSISGGGATTPPFADLYSVLLDGVDEHININSTLTALSGTSQGTISLWVKPVNSTPLSPSRIISFGDTDANSGMRLRIHSTGKLQFFSSKTNIIQSNLFSDNVLFADNTWAHIGVVQNGGGGGTTLYFNGVAIAQTYTTSTNIDHWFADDLGLDTGRIGCINFNSGGNSDFFNGNVDDIVFTSDAKSGAEMLAIYNGGSPKDESAISNGVSYFKIDGDIVNTCNDSIGTNNGTYVNVGQLKIELDTP